jgi:hypothetical protein
MSGQVRMLSIPVNDRSALEQETCVDAKGVQFIVFVSPYDVPEAISGSFDPKSNRFVIRFAYSWNEPTERHEYAKGVTLLIGRKSRRLHEIEVDVTITGASRVELSIRNAFQEAERHSPSWRTPLDNLAFAQGLYNRNSTQLLGTMSHS